MFDTFWMAMLFAVLALMAVEVIWLFATFFICIVSDLVRGIREKLRSGREKQQ